METNSELNFEIDGIYCARCNERLGWIAEDEMHDCIACYYCGEYDSCICGAQYCETCIQSILDCDCGRYNSIDKDLKGEKGLNGFDVTDIHN